MKSRKKRRCSIAKQTLKGFEERRREQMLSDFFSFYKLDQLEVSSFSTLLVWQIFLALVCFFALLKWQTPRNAVLGRFAMMMGIQGEFGLNLKCTNLNLYNFFIINLFIYVLNLIVFFLRRHLSEKKSWTLLLNFHFSDS